MRRKVGENEGVRYHYTAHFISSIVERHVCHGSNSAAITDAVHIPRTVNIPLRPYADHSGWSIPLRCETMTMKLKLYLQIFLEHWGYFRQMELPTVIVRIFSLSNLPCRLIRYSRDLRPPRWRRLLQNCHDIHHPSGKELYMLASHCETEKPACVNHWIINLNFRSKKGWLPYVNVHGPKGSLMTTELSPQAQIRLLFWRT